MSKIRECFISRFKDGYIAEADFSQLEVAALAYLTQDPVLINDITRNLDMHLVSASWVTGEDYDSLLKKYKAGDKETIAIRKAAKRPRFELQYGAGAHTIAKNNNWPISTAKDYIKRYYDRYPRVKEWQEEVAAEVQRNKRPANKFVTTGEEFISHYECPHTHRRYVFRTYPNKRGQHSFSPTQMKNYPVQGFATGDLVQTVLGEVFRYIWRNNLQNDIMLINTVHDSILFDINNNSLDSFREVLEETFGKTKEIMWIQFGIDINVPIRYSSEVGTNWANMKEFK